jgi:hypothetical protein
MEVRIGTEIVTRGAVIRMDPRGFLYKVTKEGAEYTLADAREDLDAVIKLGGGVKLPLLVDERGLRGVDQGARSFWATKQIGDYLKAVAVITGNSPITNMIGNFMMTITRPVVPLKLFSTEQAAMPWVEWFLDDEHDTAPPSIRFR